MKNRLVIKFGGTSVMTTERIKKVAQIIVGIDAEVVVVVSAMGHATDELINMSRDLAFMPDQRELDALMATGEQVSASLLAMAIQGLGRKAKSFSGAQAKIFTDTRYGDARIEKIDVQALTACLESGCIPVVTGFQGLTAGGDLATLGRGGSDTTAIALAHALHAERCDIYTDVDGIYSADPRLISEAVRLDEVSVAEMLALAENGAQVLNARSVEIARDRKVSVRVRSTFKPDDAGTLVCAASQQKRPFTGVTINNALSCIEVELDKLELAPGRNLRSLRSGRSETCAHIIEVLADAGISAEIVHAVKPNPFKILLTVNKNNSVEACAQLHKSALSTRHVKVLLDTAAVVLVASEVNGELEASALEALRQSQIPTVAAGRDSKKIIVLVPSSIATVAAHTVHSHFVGAKMTA